MLLAIDVGNTHTVYGVHNGTEWLGLWRRPTDPGDTEDQIAGWLKSLFDLSGVAWRIERVIVASVVPGMNTVLELFAEKFFRAPVRFIRGGDPIGLEVRYDPPHAVGADRLANALGALQRYAPPIIVVDFGTATTFDVVDADGAYAGGAILPGVAVATQGLVSRTAKLPGIEFIAPEHAIGRTTTASLQSGVMFGYAGAIDALAGRIRAELGVPARVIATGGLGAIFMGLASSIDEYDATLTLDGLLVAAERLFAV